jgi:F-type H+-transporting ATPase subunit epsilon
VVEDTINFRVKLITPEKSFFDGEAGFVVLPAYDGEVGILPGHQPLIARLGKGPLRIHTGSGKRFFYIRGAFAEVSGGVLTVLTEYAEPVDPSAVEDAERALDETWAASGDIEDKRGAVTKARAVRRIAKDNARD